jgi:hypothetical protein
MANDRRMSENPRSPEHHDLTGTGAPRSADEGLVGTAGTAKAGGRPDGDRGTSPAGGIAETQVNRSGSGGSGGPATPDPSVEGSTGSSMSELLSGEDDAEPQAG